MMSIGSYMAAKSYLPANCSKKTTMDNFAVLVNCFFSNARTNSCTPIGIAKNCRTRQTISFSFIKRTICCW